MVLYTIRHLFRSALHPSSNSAPSNPPPPSSSESSSDDRSSNHSSPHPFSKACPVNHGKGTSTPPNHPFYQQQATHSYIGSPTPADGKNPLTGGCPIPHHARGVPPNHPPVDGSSSASTHSSSSSSTPTPSAVSSPPPSSSSSVNEPPEGSDHIISGAHSSAAYLYVAKDQNKDLLIDPSDAEGEEVPASLIPAAGRGNSDDGANWVNPSPNQLYRALKRKNKDIEKSDARSVAAIHEWVTNGTWDEIEKYEKVLYPSCPTKLVRFQGQDGNYSMKAWLVSKVMGKSSLPFDRHDWYIDRCGKEVKYIIDYYSYEIKGPDAESKDTYTVYTIDARPAPTVGGTIDRLRMAWNRYRKGEEWW